MERNTTSGIMLILLLASVLLSSSFVFPARSWVYPDGSQDSKFETFGPRLDRILINMYANDVAEFTALENNDIDVVDWPLTKFYLMRWSAPPYSDYIKTWNYGGEAGYYILDINNNNQPLLQDGSPNPRYPEPGSVLEFRQAIAYLVNRTHNVQVIAEGMALPIYVPVPNYMEPVLPPGTQTYEPTSRASAAAKLEAGHFTLTNSPDGWRYWDRNLNSQKEIDEDMVIVIYGRSDNSWQGNVAAHISSQLNAVNVKTQLNLWSRAGCSYQVFGNKNFHIYTGYWSSIGPDPDYLYDLYHSSMYWHPGKPPNYADINDTGLDTLLEQIKCANNISEAWTATEDFKVYWSQNAFSIALMSTAGYKAHRIDYLGTPGMPDAEDAWEGEPWEGIVNEAGFGVNSRWAFLNAHPNNTEYGDGSHMTMRYGFKTSSIDSFNPIYAEGYWDWEILGKIYDQGASTNPYDLSSSLPTLYEAWEPGLWVDPVTGEYKSKVAVTMRPGLSWTDGYPVTPVDIEFTLVNVAKMLLNKGLPPPWWYPAVQYMRSFKQLDPYNIEILLDVKSAWAINWAIGTVIIPKHIWKPIIDASTPANMNDQGRVHHKYPDPNLIGTGSYRLQTYVEAPPYSSYAVLVSNDQGKTVQTNLDLSIPITRPAGVGTNYAPITTEVLSPLGEKVVLSTPPKIRFDQSFKIVNYPGVNIEAIQHTVGNWVKMENVHWAQADIEFTYKLVTKPIPDPDASTPNGQILTMDEDWVPTPEEIALSEACRDPNSMNVYIIQNFTLAGGAASGTTGETERPRDFANPASNPSGEAQPFIVVDYDTGDPIDTANANYGTLSHEKGHFLGLTHGRELHPGQDDWDVDGDGDSDADDRANLMWPYQDRTGNKLVANQISTARTNGETMADNGLGAKLTTGKKEQKFSTPTKSPWINVTYFIWVTINEDIAGSTFHDDIGLGTYPYKRDLLTPDFIVDIDDVMLAALAFATVPGHPRWAPVADITGDYKIDIDDVIHIAMKFGWAG